jgi:predicted dehydrogenase
LDILGENGSLVISDDTLDLFLDSAAGQYREGKTFLSANDLFSGVYIDIGGAKFTYQDQEFIKAILEKRETSPSIKEGFHIQKIVDACYESASENGSPVIIK